MFEPWTGVYLIGALICFTVAYRTFFVKKNPSQSRKIFGLVSLFGGVICILDFLTQVAGPVMLSIYLQDIIGFLYPLTVFLFMLMPLTLQSKLENKTILRIMVLPLLIGLLPIICGEITGVENRNFNDIVFVKLIYNEIVYYIWLFLNAMPLVVMYYFFYKIFKLPDVRANADSMNRLETFVFAFTLLIFVGYVTAIAEVIYGTPPLSSVGVAVGISLAMGAFKVRHEKM
ncbi:MAG: hypothetical protein MSIBF_01025 [Candidatus Altiarchaeales archaeon IMC4]|nr:MAG: hypothetical protein MSIBF_01025 [Candidatus Altiarchaeales archaeon IMC4]